jgi:S-formylglutathione hydrolase
MEGGTNLMRLRLATDLVPSPAEFSVLLPDGYEGAKKPFPLMFVLHGGGGDNGFLEQMRPLIEHACRNGLLPPLVAVTPDADRSLYMDFCDGSEKWESFVVGPLLDHLRATYRLAPGREGTAIVGISMGGMGALRLGFKYPDRFVAVAALEPGIEPALAFKDIELRDRFYWEEELLERIFGKPVDEAYWQANNPANIAKADPARLRDSGLAIYLECGTEDCLYLYHGTEFLHRILFDHRIRHEYRLVRGADHVGWTLWPRFLDALAFLGRVLNPPPPDETLVPFRRRVEEMKQQAGYTEDD